MKPKQLKERRAVIFIENLFEDLELFYPRFRLMEEGMEVIIAGPKAKETYHSKHGYPCQSDITFQDAKESEFDALIIPGGYAPDKIRAHQSALEIVQQFNQKRKVIAFICHGGWVPASANVLKGVRCTSYFNIKDDMLNAGAQWIDEPVVVDQHFISSRTPKDLPFFCPAIIETILHSQEYSHC